MIARHTHLVMALALLTLGLCPTPAAADNAPRDHDRGFLLRLSGGGGSASIKADANRSGHTFAPGVEVKLSGVAGDGNMAIGALVGHNLAVHGTFWGWSVTDPDLEIGGLTAATNDLTLRMNAFGPGITWYFGQNFYLSGSVGAATLTAEVDRVSLDSKTGVAVDFTIGKEWWVGNRWGLGVAAGFGVQSIPTDDPDLEDNFSGQSFALRFSATYN